MVLLKKMTNIISKMSNNTVVDIKQNEALFQYYWDQYWHTSRKDAQEKAWKRMWECVFAACCNITKHIYMQRSVIVPDDELFDKITDATAYVMQFIQKGVRPEKLGTYCYLRCRRYIDNVKEIEISKNETQFLYDEEGRQLEIGEYWDKKDLGEE